MKRIFIWIGIIVVIALAVWGMVVAAQRSPAVSSAPGTDTSEIRTNDWVKGTTTPKITITEYADFQCPACYSYDTTVIRPLMNDPKYAGVVRFVYRHFPLSQIHPNADLAASASEAAGLQGKFWEMHDKLFDTQNEWSASRTARATFEGYAMELGLDVEKFRTDISSGDVRRKVNDDYKLGVAAGVFGTPTFFINGVEMGRVNSLDEFKKNIDDAIAQNS